MSTFLTTHRASIYRPAWRVLGAGLCLILGLFAQAAVAASDNAAGAAVPRHALVIGNSQYVVGALVNPGNDARAMAEQLRLAGFAVTLKVDAGRRDMQEALRTFAEQLHADKGIGVFYFAGHGVQLNWRNFLLPVDARIRAKADVQAQAVDLEVLFDGLARARNALNIVILDACRNNPFGNDFRVDDPGLSQLDAPNGTLLAFATAPGNTAEDGSGDHGLYTGNLLQEMQAPGAAVEDVFKRVRLAVRRGSQGSQIPWESTSLEADFSFLAGKASGDSAQEFQDDLAAWQQLRRADSVDSLDAFIRHRPSGKFAEMAQFRLDQLLAAKGEKSVRPVAASTENCAPGKAAAVYTGPAVAYRPGERYRYRRVNLLDGSEIGRNDLTVAKISDDEVQFNDGATVTDLFGNQVRAPDGRKWTPYQFFIADYQVGKKWSAQFLVTQADGKQLNNDFELRVVGRERITLPAGNFDAFRIQARGTNLSNGDTLERTAWVAPEKMRGVLAMESTVHRNGKLVEAERSELLNYTAPPAKSSLGGLPAAY